MTGVPLLEGNRMLLQEGIALLEGPSDRLYAEPVREWAPVGAPYRHVLEHYQSFLTGVPLGRVDWRSSSTGRELQFLYQRAALR